MRTQSHYVLELHTYVILKYSRKSYKFQERSWRAYVFFMISRYDLGGEITSHRFRSTVVIEEPTFVEDKSKLVRGFSVLPSIEYKRMPAGMKSGIILFGITSDYDDTRNFNSRYQLPRTRVIIEFIYTQTGPPIMTADLFVVRPTSM